MPRLPIFFLWGLLLVLAGCVDPYEPSVISSSARYLVVDGFINLNGVSTFRLSRTQNLGASTPPPTEPRAALAIRDDSGRLFPLTESAPGTYVSQSLALPPGREYQLQIRTAAGRQYLSDLVQAKLTPPIDSVTWSAGGLGVRVAVHARDPSNATRYYRWSYIETWEFTSAYYSQFEFTGGAMRRRTENIYNCWGTEKSPTINLTSTTRLTQDVVTDFPLTLLPRNSPKLRFRYSVLVSQFAQTPEEYSYWEKLKKNTESIGSLFDPLPSQLSGNVRCLDDANETVIGYVGAASVSQKRIFIANAQLPRGTINLNGYENCQAQDTIPAAQVSTVFRNPRVIPIDAIYPAVGVIPIAYTAGTPECIDCRQRGTNVKPSFWP